jgi:hypothetical protein
MAATPHKVLSWQRVAAVGKEGLLDFFDCTPFFEHV